MSTVSSPMPRFLRSQASCSSSAVCIINALPSRCLPRQRRSPVMPRAAAASIGLRSHETDVVVIGGGIGGLCAGALLAKYGLSVTVCESHDVAGGCAHSWERDGYTFESGPSLYSGMSDWPSNNPMGQVLHALDEALPCIKYNTWQCHLPEGSFLTEIGNDQFLDVLRKYHGEPAAAEWTKLKALMRPLASASVAVPAAAVRTDAAALVTLARFLPRLLAAPAAVGQITQPFSEVMKSGGITHPFVVRWMEMLCFLLSGAPASGTLAAEIGFMFNDWYGSEGAALEYPVGGSGALIEALTRGLRKFGGRLETRAHVEAVLCDGGRASGVRLRDGSVIAARRAVVSNASVWDTLPLLPPGAVPREWARAAEATAECESFMHLHLGIDAEGLDPDLEIHHISIEEWERGVAAEQNLVLVSIPSALAPGMAPKGKAVVHAYTPGTEPYSRWAGLRRASAQSLLR